MFSWLAFFFFFAWVRLRLQDDLKRCVQAGRVQVSAFCPHGGHDATSGRKLCLQLDKFKVVKPSQKQKSLGYGVLGGSTVGVSFFLICFLVVSLWLFAATLEVRVEGSL